MSVTYTKHQFNPDGTTGRLLAAQRWDDGRWTDLLAGPKLRLLGAPDPVPAGHVELDVATLPEDLRERGVVQATTDNLTLLRAVRRYAGVLSVAGSAERQRRIELNILWYALDRDGIPGGGYGCDYPAGTCCPWSLDHPDLWDEEGWENCSDDEIMSACVRMREGGLLQRQGDWLLHLTPEGRRRLACEGGQALLDAHDAVPRDKNGEVLPMNPPNKPMTDEERKAAHAELNREWQAYWDRKRAMVRQVRRELAWGPV